MLFVTVDWRGASAGCYGDYSVCARPAYRDAGGAGNRSSLYRYTLLYSTPLFYSPLLCYRITVSMVFKYLTINIENITDGVLGTLNINQLKHV